MSEFNRYKVYGLLIKSEMDINEFIVEAFATKIFDAKIVLEEMPKTIKESILDGRNIFIEANDVWFHIDGVANYRITNGNKIAIEADKYANINDIKSYLLGTCMGHLLYQKKILAIHGGAIEANNKALIIVGESGSGKTTLTTALRLKGYRFITDDLATIEFRSSIAVNHGYPGQRLCDDGMELFGYDVSKYQMINLDNRMKYVIPVRENFINKKTELGAIFEITTGNVNKVCIEEIFGGEKLKLVLRNVYSLKWVKHLGVNPLYFRQCLDLAKNIKIYKIIRPNEGFTVSDQISAIEEKIGNIKEQQRI